MKAVDSKKLDELYKEWSGEHHTTNSNKQVHDSAECTDFAEYCLKYAFQEFKDAELKEAEKAIKQNESAIRMLAKQRDEMDAKLREAMELTNIAKWIISGLIGNYSEHTFPTEEAINVGLDYILEVNKQDIKGNDID